MITKFADIFKDYDTFSNKDYLMNKVTGRLLGQVSTIFIKGLRNKVQNYKGSGRIDEDSSLRVLCNIVCEYTEIQETTNWEWYFIIEDYKEAFQRFLLRPFYKFMDATSKVTIEFLDGEIVTDLNKAFAENNFGYRILNDPKLPWICLNPSINKLKKVDEVQEKPKELCQKTTNQIDRTKEDLLGSKITAIDAVKDCLFSLERILKMVTNADNITEALENMKQNTDIWGPEEITSDGIKLWNLFNTDDPEVSFPRDDINKITLNQAAYYLDRIQAYVSYIMRVAR